MYTLDDNIVAIASAPGSAFRGIVRLSGPDIVGMLEGLFQSADGGKLVGSTQPSIKAGQLRLATLHSALPCELYVWPNRRSYTGQPVIEIHTIGSPPLLQLVLRAMCATGMRLAAPGEFTMRAFLSGRIDLTQAEAVLGVIDATNNEDLQVALRQLAGGLSKPLNHVRDSLLDLLVHLEASFDFADEDIHFIEQTEIKRRLRLAADEVNTLVHRLHDRTEPLDVFRVVLTGRPNVGKSSLFNLLAKNHTAIVSEHAGTTRDYLTAEIKIEGMRVILTDTAGIGDLGNNTGDSIDRTAMELADRAVREANLIVLCIDATRPLDNWEKNELQRQDKRRIAVLTKCDGVRRSDFLQPDVETSAKTGSGIQELKAAIRRHILAEAENRAGVVSGTIARCRESLHIAARCLESAKIAADNGQDELVAAEVRSAVEEIGKITGAVYTEDILERIFSRFCVGK